MTSTNMNLKNKPFLLTPAGKDYLWGGSRMRTEFNKDIPLETLVETWECSTHPDGSSVVESGIYEGMSLPQVLKKHPEYLGTHPGLADELPILIEFIDAKKDLSVQVHLDDNYARECENGQLGKTEMWYIMDAAPDVQLIYGFYHDITKEQLRKSLEDSTVEKYLQKVKIQKDDVFLLNQGQFMLLARVLSLQKYRKIPI